MSTTAGLASPPRTEASPFLRVRRCLNAWENIGAGPMILNWIANGYKLPLTGPVEPFNIPPLHQHNPQEVAALQEIKAKLLSMGVITRTTNNNFVSRSRLEPKKDGGYRLVVDLRPLNAYLPETTCKYETLNDAQFLLQRQDWMISADLKDGYYHLGIHKDHQQYLTTMLDGELVQFTALPFGLSTAPRVFTKFMRPVVKYFRSNGIRMLQYLDDSLFLSQSHAELLNIRQFVEETFTELGLLRKESKGCWEPAQHLIHLGIAIDTERGLFLIPPHKQATIRGAASSLLRYSASHRRWVSVKKLANLAGMVISTTIAFPLARTLTRSLYDVIATRVSWTRDVRLDKQTIRDLQFLSKLDAVFCDKAIWEPQPLARINTDASLTGWGAILDDLVPAQGFFSKGEQALHITAKELNAVLFALQRFHNNLVNKPVRIVTDNMSVMAVINKGVSHSRTMMSIYRKMLKFCLERGILLKAEYINTHHNVVADALSRISPFSDWSIPQELFAQMELMFGKRTCDRFASPTSARCHKYNSVIPGNDSLGDAFLQSTWINERNWICPPISLAARVIDRLYHEGAEALLVVPYWRSATWFPMLMEMADYHRVLTAQEMSQIESHGPGPPEVHRNHHWRLVIVHIPEREARLEYC